jgi:hypothetical protein
MRISFQRGGVGWVVAGWREGWAEFMLPNDTSVKDLGTFICFLGWAQETKENQNKTKRN